MAGTNTPNKTGRTTAASKRAAAAATNTNSNGRPRRAAGDASPYASTSTSTGSRSSSPSKGKGKAASTSTSTTKGKSTSSKGKKAPPATVAREAEEEQGDRAETQTQAGSSKVDAKPPLEAGSAQQTRCVPPFLPPRQQLHFVILSWDSPGRASSAAYRLTPFRVSPSLQLRAQRPEYLGVFEKRGDRTGGQKGLERRNLFDHNHNGAFSRARRKGWPGSKVNGNRSFCSSSSAFQPRPSRSDRLVCILFFLPLCVRSTRERDQRRRRTPKVGSIDAIQGGLRQPESTPARFGRSVDLDHRRENQERSDRQRVCSGCDDRTRMEEVCERTRVGKDGRRVDLWLLLLLPGADFCE